MDSEASEKPASEVPLGIIVGAHGLRGELRVRASDGDIESLSRVTSIRLVREEGDPDPREHEVRSVRPGRQGECRLGLAGVSDRDAAEALLGRRLIARATELPTLPPGEFYAHQLVGCRVVTADGAEIGRVREIWETGAADILVIEDAQGREELVPAVEPLLREVDLAAGRIVVEAPPGLIGSQVEPDRE